MVYCVALSLQYKLHKIFKKRTYVRCCFIYSVVSEEQIFFYNTNQTISLPPSLPLSLHHCCQHCPPPLHIIFLHLLKAVQPLWVILTWWIIKTFETHSVGLRLDCSRWAREGSWYDTWLNIARGGTCGLDYEKLSVQSSWRQLPWPVVYNMAAMFFFPVIPNTVEQNGFCHLENWTTNARVCSATPQGWIKHYRHAWYSVTHYN